MKKLLIVPIICTTILTGCVTSNPDDIKVNMTTNSKVVSDADYILKLENIIEESDKLCEDTLEELETGEHENEYENDVFYQDSKAEVVKYKLFIEELSKIKPMKSDNVEVHNMVLSTVNELFENNKELMKTVKEEYELKNKHSGMLNEKDYNKEEYKKISLQLDENYEKFKMLQDIIDNKLEEANEYVNALYYNLGLK